jgi:peroxiredoxin
MWQFIKASSFSLICFAVILLSVAAVSHAQSPEPIKPTGKTIFRDSDGNLISNDEFVDIRMANFHLPDRTLMRTLEDGTVEFRLQKIPQEGAAMPQLSVETLDGQTVTTEDLKGKVIVLNFWFIGCPACMYEMPKLNEMATKFAGNDSVVFLAMTTDPEHQVKKFLSREKFDYRIAAAAGPAMKSFGFSGFPKNIVISKDGTIVYWRSPIHAWDKFESVIRAEIEKSS